ncbi:MAG: metallophosphoesterase [Deltaproteobacteria bacterium]|nr:metallophosphoesterase [Deltaproteobacteria bacterium]
MRFFLFIATAQSILFFGHWFLYRTLVSFFGVTSPLWLWSLRVAMGLLSISLVGSSFFSFRYSNLLVRSLYTASVSWLGILYLLFLASLLAWTVYGLIKLFHLPMDRRALIIVLFGIALIGSLYGFINAGIIRINTVSLPLPNLPGAWEGKTAVWISDVHLGQVRNNRFAQHLADMIQDLRPDIVFIGGDLYDGGEAMDLNHMVEPLSRLSPSYGAYFVTGNHEEFYDNTPYLNAVRRTGIRVLNNEKVEIEGLQLIGAGYRDSRNQKQFRAMLQKMEIDRRKPSILLKHVPFDLEIVMDQGISAQISGHTHQGQVFLFRFITSKIYKGYDYGLKRFGDLLVYTSSGAGTWGPPMRLDTKPEIVVIKFVKKN